MNHSGDAAEQIVRLSLEGTEIALKLTGTAAKEIALFLLAALKGDKKHLKSRGRARLTSLLKSGKPLEIFSVKESDLKQFVQGAKQYGIVYCVLRNRSSKASKAGGLGPDGMCDIMVKAEDAPKISRLVERFQFATVDKAKIESEIVAARAEKAEGAEPDAPDVNDTEKLLDDLLGTGEGKADPGKGAADGHPFVNGEPPSPPSAPTSEPKKSGERSSSEKPSVRETLREIRAAQKAKESDVPQRDEQAAGKQKGKRIATTHKQPQGGKRLKSKKTKERA